MSMRRLLAVLALTLAAGCAQKLPATGCKADSQCPAASRCTTGVCTADSRPVAAIQPLGVVEEFALVTLDGSASGDADGDLSEHLWTIRSIDAPCAAPEIANRTALTPVRFACSGRYEVTLTVADALGMSSDPVQREVTVRPSTATSLVVAGQDLATDHVCSGPSFRCRTTKEVRLRATAASGAPVRWTVQPPVERPLDEHRRVSLELDGATGDVVAQIVTDGTAIAGDWIFRAEVTDEFGVVGADVTRVSVRNRPPVITFAPPAPFQHAFDPARSIFTSEGTVAWSIVDPDGDPFTLEGIWRHVGDGDQSWFDGDFAGTTVFFSVEVPYAAPEDGLLLRGGAGLVREIELRALDANRQAGVAVIPIEIGNRPPVPAGGTHDATVPHRYDPAQRRYVAAVRVGTFVDPDGDPLVDSTSDTLCGTLRVEGNEVTAECSAPFVDVASLGQLVGSRTFPVAPRDLWEAPTTVPYHTVEIRNSAPRFVTVAPSGPTYCVWYWFGGFDCGLELYPDAVSFDVTLEAADPDGDPLALVPWTAAGGSVSPERVVITARAPVSVHIDQPRVLLCSWDGWLPPQSHIDVSDGVGGARADASPPWIPCAG